MIRILLLAVIFACAAYFALGGDSFDLQALSERFTTGPQASELVMLAGLIVMLLILVPALVGGYRGRIGNAVRDVISWVCLGVMLVGGYSYRDEIGRIAYRIAGEFNPGGVPMSVEQGQSGERAVRIRRRADGHFVARVSVNGAGVPMLVDTGASTVVLRQADAKQLGVDTRHLKYTVPVQTANGLAYAAHARLSAVAIGGIILHNVDAL
ncbi:MAG: TIGR02281 family clan AA aspartic protease, partial [Proteobacteria bacterium]|nr:TIGR02281 family clan AA aspartic protease [Pseudomonadota bacterium]